MKKIIMAAAVMIILFNAAAEATISFVKLQAGVNVPQNLSLNHAVSSRKVKGFRVPFVSGTNHVVDLTGAFLDVCDRVEICNSSGAVQRTLAGSSLNKFKSNNEGQCILLNGIVEV
jgi:urea transporter